MIKPILPTFNPGEGITNGCAFDSYKFCQKRVVKECTSFYREIFDEKKYGFTECPNGMTIYYDELSDTIFTSVIVFNRSSMSKIKKLKKEFSFDKNPYVFEESKFLELVAKSRDLISNFDVVENCELRLSHIIHDMKYHVDRLDDVNELTSKVLHVRQPKKIKLPELKSNLSLSYRLIKSLKSAFFNQSLLISDEVLRKQSVVDINIYSVLNPHKEQIFNTRTYERTKVKISGKWSDNKFRARLLFFSAVDGVMDNAVKYQPQDDSFDRYQKINIHLSEDSNKKYMYIESYGPLVEAGEEEKVFEPRYRGKHIKTDLHQGSGLGLATIKKYCNIDNIDVKCKSNEFEGYNEAGVKYYPFRITFSINKV